MIGAKASIDPVVYRLLRSTWIILAIDSINLANVRSNTVGTIIELSLNGLTHKNALLIEQRAEVLPIVRGLDGAGSVILVKNAYMTHYEHK